MASILDMPQLSDTMKEGVLRKWRKNEGDKVAPGEVLAEVETDKATMDFEAFDEGVVLKRLIADGATVPVGAPIAIIGNTGEDISALVQQAEARKGGGQKAAAPAASPASTGGQAPAAKTTPAAPTPQPQSAPAQAAAPKASSPAPRPAPSNGHVTGAPSAKILASPLARRLATDLGVDLRTVQGSGPGGRIVERDVKTAAEEGAAPDETTHTWQRSHGGADQAGSGTDKETTQPGRPGAEAKGPLPSQIFPDRRSEPRPAAVPPSGDTEKPLSMMRRTIARRLLESKTQIPHFYLTADVDMAAAMEFREQVNQVHGARLSVNDLVLKATALALRKVPEANASFTEEAIILRARVDVSMAVAIEDGLVTPVIRDADKKTLGQIANEAKDLAARARDRKLRPEEMTGGTFSVSNLGMFGIRDFAAIINPPEAGILAVGTVRKEPVVKDDKIVVGQRMSLTLSCDHRAVDGATGAKLMQAIVAILERPITLAF